MSSTSEIKTVNPKANQSSAFIRRTDAEADALILWPLDAKSQLIRKSLMLGKIEGRRRKGQQRMGWLDGITNSMDMKLSKLWRAAVHGVRPDWTTMVPLLCLCTILNTSVTSAVISVSKGLSVGPITHQPIPDYLCVLTQTGPPNSVLLQ